MSVQTEMDRINQNIANTYSVLAALGADMPENMNSENLPQTAGTAKAVLYAEQALTDEQKRQARENIGAVSPDEITDAVNDGLNDAKKSGEFKGDPGNDYVLTETDKDEIAAIVVEKLGGEPIFGFVDENNNIIVQGNLADGTYNVKYEMEDGSTVDIGNLVLDSNVYYTVTNKLTNCTNSNNAVQAIGGQGYTATITANSGYELKSVSVTMGGSPVTVSGGVINIAKVTGNIVITAVAEETSVEIVNQIPISTDTDGTIYNNVGYKTNTRINSGGLAVDAPGVSVTGFIPVKKGDKVYVKGLYVTGDNTGYTQIAVYNAAKTTRIAFYAPTNSYISEGNGVYSHTITEDNAAFIRASVYKIMDGSEIVTINQPIS
jgi:hypothetical protein